MTETMTGTLARVAAAAGQAAAVALAAAYGGRRLYLPAHLPADHHLCRLIGFDAAMRLRSALGPGHLDVPMGRRPHADATARAVADLSRRGRSAAAIAAALGVSMRTVRYHRARHRRG